MKLVHAYLAALKRNQGIIRGARLLAEIECIQILRLSNKINISSGGREILGLYIYGVPFVSK